MQGHFPNRERPLCLSVIAQLFALEVEARQGWVPKQPGPGICWQEYAWSFLKWGFQGLEEGGPSEELGEPTCDWFLWSAFQTWGVAGRGGGTNTLLICLAFPV